MPQKEVVFTGWVESPSFGPIIWIDDGINQHLEWNEEVFALKGKQEDWEEGWPPQKVEITVRYL